MSTSPDTPSGPPPGALPPPLTVAASLVAVQGLVLGILAVLELASVDAERAELGLSTAAFFTAYAVVLLAAAWGLSRRSTWSRGPALLTQLIGLGLAWSLREHVAVAVVLALTSVVTLLGLVHPDTIEAMESERGPQDDD